MTISRRYASDCYHTYASIVLQFNMEAIRCRCTICHLCDDSAVDSVLLAERCHVQISNRQRAKFRPNDRAPLNLITSSHSFTAKLALLNLKRYSPQDNNLGNRSLPCLVSTSVRMVHYKRISISGVPPWKRNRSLYC